MRLICPATGYRVPANRDGRATCPICEDSWHSLTRAGTLRPHVPTLAARQFSASQVGARLNGLVKVEGQR